MTRKDYNNLCMILVSCGLTLAQINEFAVRMAKFYPNINVDKFRGCAIKLISEIKEKTI